MNNFPLFFVHIPKTAGSSFRIAAEQYFGREATYCDYGKNSKETHADILEFEYELSDRFLAAKCIKKNAKFLSGHVIYPKYAPFFHAKSVVTFLRDPAQQVRSHYEHFSRLHGYTGSFEDFIKENRFSNMQSKSLNGVWTDAIGFIGITERYNESITLFNEYYGTDIKVLDINKNEAKSTSSYTFTEGEVELIRKMNAQDFELYDYALKRFDLHRSLLDNKLPLIRFGAMNISSKDKGKKFSIWGCCFEQDKAIEADILLDDVVVEQVTLSDYRALGAERNIHRNGFVGKSYVYPEAFETGQTVKVREKQTQLIIFEDVVS